MMIVIISDECALLMIVIDMTRASYFPMLLLKMNKRDAEENIGIP